MHTPYSNFFIIITLIISSCGNAQPYGAPVREPDIILKDTKSFIDYWGTLLRLSDDFTPLDTNEVPMTKEDFLKKVSTSDYLPVRLRSNSPTYKLFKINREKTNPLIRGYLRDVGKEEYNNYFWEGKPLPAFDFNDLEGNVYNQQNTKGKTLVLNFWFIGCVPCVEEIPDLNKLALQYKNQKDILFIAFALDSEKDLKSFLKVTKFKYHIISDTTGFLHRALGIRGYPAQVLINNTGTVVKIFSNFHSYDRLVAALKKEAPE